MRPEFFDNAQFCSRSLLAGSFCKCRLGVVVGGFTILGALARLATRTARCPAARSPFRRGCGIYLFGLFDHDFRWSAFDDGLRTGTVNDGRLLLGHGGLLLPAFLPILPAIAALVAVAPVLARLLVLGLVALFAARLLLLRCRSFVDDRLLAETEFIRIAGFQIILIQHAAVTVLIAAIVAMKAILHLRLSGGYDAVIMFCVLQVVLGHDPVAGALRIAGKR
ncbi:hypothetical protein JL39_26360 [Rhizobium sp. YS-1r]|nr:hypothetical protein JL39_26360 [Rhizobium sp. YS-1r]